MSHRFDPRSGLIIIASRLFGPDGDVVLRLALDTGATSTLINTDIMVLVGYDPAAVPERIQVTTGSGVEFCARIAVQRIEALGRTLEHFPLLCHTLPPSAQVDGLLGLDFFRGCRIGIDLRTGVVTVE